VSPSAGGRSQRVSCIVPAYNSAAFIAEALDSILAQSHPPFEVIVADDGSGDETASIARAHDDRVRVVAQPTAGPGATRNLGFAHSRGEYVAFLDADDRWHPRKLERQLERFRARPGLELSVTNVQLFWADEDAAEAERYADHPRAQPVPGYATTTLLARRVAFAHVGPLDTERWFTDATDWFVRARELGLEIELLEEVLTFHRMHGGNLTRRRSQASRDEFVTLVKGALDRRRAGASGDAE
jgi:glycosyltransferase involved in cell wall biosynthesis